MSLIDPVILNQATRARIAAEAAGKGSGTLSILDIQTSEDVTLGTLVDVNSSGEIVASQPSIDLGLDNLSDQDGILTANSYTEFLYSSVGDCYIVVMNSTIKSFKIDGTNFNEVDSLVLAGSITTDVKMHPSGKYLACLSGSGSGSATQTFRTVSIDASGNLTQVASTVMTTTTNDEAVNGQITYSPSADKWTAIFGTDDSLTDTYNVVLYTLQVNINTYAVYNTASVVFRTNYGTGGTDLRGMYIQDAGDSKLLLLDKNERVNVGDTREIKLELVDISGSPTVVGTSAVLTNFNTSPSEVASPTQCLMYSEHSDRYYIFSVRSGNLSYDAIVANTTTDVVTLDLSAQSLAVDPSTYTESGDILRKNFQFINDGKHLVVSTGNYNSAVKLFSVNPTTGVLTEVGNITTIASIQDYFLLVKNAASADPEDYIALNTVTGSVAIPLGLVKIDFIAPSISSYNFTDFPDAVGVTTTNALTGEKSNILMLGPYVGTALDGYTGLIPKQKYYINKLNELTTSPANGALYLGIAISPTRLISSSDFINDSVETAEPVSKLPVTTVTSNVSNTTGTVLSLSGTDGGVIDGIYFVTTHNDGTSLSELTLTIDAEVSEELIPASVEPNLATMGYIPINREFTSDVTLQARLGTATNRDIIISYRLR
jgi:6-phosphogluconolactonase (cycloisomerase 2 family)